MLQEIDMATHRPSVSKLLVMGDYGGGKTHFIGTLPKPVLHYSFDKGYDTVAMMPGIKVVSVQEDDRRRPKAWIEFNEHFRKFTGGKLLYKWPDGRLEAYKSSALDSLTFLSAFCLNHYQFMGSNVDKKATYTQYQQLLENMGDVISASRRCVEVVCCTALVKVDKDELTGEVLALPNMTGSIRDVLGAHFDAVFYVYVDKTPQGKEVFKMKTVGGYREKAKIRLPADIKIAIAPTIEDPNFETLIGKINARIESVYGNLPQPPKEAPQAAPALLGPKPAFLVPVAAPKPAVAAPAAKPAAPKLVGARPTATPAAAAPKPAAPAPAPVPAAAPQPVKASPQPVPALVPKPTATKSGYKPPKVKIKPRER